MNLVDIIDINLLDRFLTNLKNLFLNKDGTATKAASIPFGTVDSTSTATAFTATVDGITELRDGVSCYLKNTVITSAAATTNPKCWTLNINNLGAKPVYVTTAAATYSTTQFTVNYKFLFTYDSSLNSGNGGWYIGQLFNSNTTYSAITQAEIDAGTSTTARLITPKLLRDNFYTETESDTNFAKVPLVIEVNDTDTTVPSGTYASITTALAAGREVVVKATMTEEDNQIMYFHLSRDYTEVDDSYSFSCSIYGDTFNLYLTTDDECFLSKTQTAVYDHWHGNLLSNGTLQDNDITIANGDKLVVTDSSDSSKIARASVSFDGSTTTKALTPKGTWETFLQSYTETDPTVPAWAKAANKPSYTAAEVGALPDSTTIPSASTDIPQMDGVGAAGSASTYAKGDHVHPTDTSREARVITVSHGTSDTTFTLTPNVLHIWGTVNSLTLSLASGSSTYVDGYWFKFTAGSNFTALTLPTGVDWVTEPDIEAGKTYEVMIVDGLACYLTDGIENNYATQQWVQNNTQAPLVSGTNIKTINGTSILGEGNISISGGDGSGDTNIIEVVKVNGTALTPDANKAVDVIVPTTISSLSDDATHRVVTDTEKSTWNGKVGSTTINTVVSLTEAQYIALATKDSSTLYIITSS